MASLVNAVRKAIGKGGVGWLNPALYKYVSLYANDIVSGDNTCTRTMCCGTGFNATKGWDAATGIGSINFKKFSRVFQYLGNKLNIPTAVPTKSPSETNTPSFTKSARPTSKSTTSKPTTSNTGWMYKYTYQQSGCRGQVISVNAVPIGECLSQYQLIGNTPQLLASKCFPVMEVIVIMNSFASCWNSFKFPRQVFQVYLTSLVLDVLSMVAILSGPCHT